MSLLKKSDGNRDNAVTTKAQREANKLARAALRHAAARHPSASTNGVFGLSLSESHPANQHIRQGWLKIDKPMAEYLLSLNTANRSVKDQQLTKLVRAQLAGLYNEQNTDAITFNQSGALINGQHRLLMVVQTGIAIYALVVVGVADDVMESMDNQTTRSVKDVLEIENLTVDAGHKNIRYVGPLVNSFLNYESRRSLRRVSRNEQSSSEILAYYKENTDRVQRLIAFGRSISERSPSFRNIVTMKRVAVLRLNLEDIGAAPEDIDVFFQMLIGRVAPNYSMSNLRARLERLQVDHSRKKKVSDDLALAILVKGWNAFVLGEEVDQFRWRSGGAKPEAFPELIVVSEQGKWPGSAYMNGRQRD